MKKIFDTMKIIVLILCPADYGVDEPFELCR